MDMEEHERLYADGSVKEAHRALQMATSAANDARPVASVEAAQVRATVGVGFALLAIARSLDALALVVRERETQ